MFAVDWWSHKEGSGSFEAEAQHHWGCTGARPHAGGGTSAGQGDQGGPHSTPAPCSCMVLNFDLSLHDCACV